MTKSVILLLKSYPPGDHILSDVPYNNTESDIDEDEDEPEEDWKVEAEESDSDIDVGDMSDGDVERRIRARRI